MLFIAKTFHKHEKCHMTAITVSLLLHWHYSALCAVMLPLRNKETNRITLFRKHNGQIKSALKSLLYLQLGWMGQYYAVHCYMTQSNMPVSWYKQNKQTKQTKNVSLLKKKFSDFHWILWFLLYFILLVVLTCFFPHPFMHPANFLWLSINQAIINKV